MSKLIQLTRGQVAIVDDHWFDRLSRYQWQCTKDGYACMSGRKHVYMHRLVAATPTGLEADHINRNRLDNQEHNLRNVTHAENIKNRGSRGSVHNWRIAHGNPTHIKTQFQGCCDH